MNETVSGCRLRIGGVVQGVGFRPFVFRLARQHALAGSVRNSAAGVDIVVEGPLGAIEAFVADLRALRPAAAAIATVSIESLDATGLTDFRILHSDGGGALSASIPADLPVCDDCLRELFDPGDRRFGYPYINCAACGPRFSLATALPYDRQATTMGAWPMCADCEREFNDPENRRFHAQPIACPACGPRYRLVRGGATVAQDGGAITAAARLLRRGAVIAVKGIGGYHLACDARNVVAVGELRERKYRKAKAFAVMARGISSARALAELSEQDEVLLTSRARPIVVVPARVDLPGVAPGHPTLGVMLPYAPLHHLLFAAGAPEALVMTSGNRSSEPIAFEDVDALGRLDGIADAFLAGERPIARRVEDSVVHTTAIGPMIVRRSRGYAPGVVARLASQTPILAVGGDLKNTVAIVVAGGVTVSPHIGDLEHHATRTAFERMAGDFLALYGVDRSRLVVAHDLHPQYASTVHALGLAARRHVGVQHHRAHVASVVAERGALSTRVIGVAFDGTGFGDDGTIWGGEFLAGSAAEGFERVAHLRPAALAGGDAAAACPAQAAAGFAAQIEGLPDLMKLPFQLPERYRHARQVAASGVRTFTSTSAGRLFDAVAAVLGFTGSISFEAQAAIWLEHLATEGTAGVPVPFDYRDRALDWRPALRSICAARAAGESVPAIARGFHCGLAEAISNVASSLCEEHQARTVVLTGGVFHNRLLLSMVHDRLAARRLVVWTNELVPPGDGGLSLGQAALASLRA